jgi:hypothetical protein
MIASCNNLGLWLHGEWESKLDEGNNLKKTINTNLQEIQIDQGPEGKRMGRAPEPFISQILVENYI